MTSRLKIPQQVADDLMYRNRHTCCVCRVPRKHVQIHHIDSNSANILFLNLAVICLDCHSLVTGDEGLGRRYTPGEVAKYKSDWEQACAVTNVQETVDAEYVEDDDDGEENDDQPADHHYEDSILEADMHIEHPYTLEENDRVALWIESDEPLTVLIIDSEDYEKWDGGKTVRFHDIYENAYKLDITFQAPSQGDYSVVISNFGDENANLQLDISVWE